MLFHQVIIKFYLLGVTIMLIPPDESDTETSIPGTEAFNGSSKAVRSSNQGKISVDWDSPKTEKVDGICKYFNLYNMESQG